MAETTLVVDENTRIHTKGGERMEKTEFSGFFVHTLDQKNRVFIPAEFRSKLGTEFVVCTPPGSTDCIIIYTFEEWDRYFENLRVLCKGRPAPMPSVSRAARRDASSQTSRAE